MGLKLKVCGMREEANVNEILEVGVDYMGFIFYDKSKRFVGDQLNEEQLKKFPALTQKVGVFVNPSYEEVIKEVDRYGLDMLQLHGDETPEFCSEFFGDVKVMKAFSVDEQFDFTRTKAYRDSCDYFLFDTKTPQYGGSGQQFDWRILEKYDNEIPFFLSGGIDEEIILDIWELQEMNIHAVDVNSRFETSPAVKDAARIKKFKEQLNQLSDELFG